jgi:hypothetical protein
MQRTFFQGAVSNWYDSLAPMQANGIEFNHAPTRKHKLCRFMAVFMFVLLCYCRLRSGASSLDASWTGAGSPIGDITGMPLYRGVSLRYWVLVSGVDPQAKAALESIGPQAVPYLLADIFEPAPSCETDPAAFQLHKQRQAGAYAALMQIETLWRAAIPELETRSTNNNPREAALARDMLTLLERLGTTSNPANSQCPHY